VYHDLTVRGHICIVETLQPYSVAIIFVKELT